MRGRGDGDGGDVESFGGGEGEEGQEGAVCLISEESEKSWNRRGWFPLFFHSFSYTHDFIDCVYRDPL